MYNPKTDFSLSFDENDLGQNNLRDKNINYIKTDTCIGAVIKGGNYWELWMLKYIKENYVENTNIVDLGGNIGTTSLLMTEILSDNCKVYTFEPIYNDVLLKNIIDNNLNDKITLYPYGIGNKHETIKIKNINLNSSINFGAVSLPQHIQNNCEKYENNSDILEINIVPLDNFNFQNVSLMKIDVENMEIEVLEGCFELIKRCKPTILIESHMINVLNQTEIFKKIMELGYNINSIDEGTNDFIMKVTK